MKYFLPLLVLFPVGAQSQNLVVNPGFETYQETSWSISSLEHCQGWVNPTAASPDYFNPNLAHNTTMVHPKDWWGYQAPMDGVACAGFIAYRSHNDKKSCEYLEARLLEPLIKGEEYTVRIHISLAECSNLSLRQLGAYFSEEEVHMKTVFMLKYKPQVNLDFTENDTATWVSVNSLYKAKGGERFMVLGCFDFDQRIHLGKETPSTNIHDPRGEAYYFIDMVSVTPVKKGLHLLQTTDTLTAIEEVLPIKDTLLTAGKTFVLENILFETGSGQLMSSSFDELDKVCLWLEKNAAVKVDIHGYTDNTGDEKKNLVLSDKRAKAVYDYFIRKNIGSERLKYHGFGEANPRDTNDTETGKAKNRRVEMELY